MLKDLNNTLSECQQKIKSDEESTNFINQIKESDTDKTIENYEIELNKLKNNLNESEIKYSKLTYDNNVLLNKIENLNKEKEIEIKVTQSLYQKQIDNYNKTISELNEKLLQTIKENNNNKNVGHSINKNIEKDKKIKYFVKQVNRKELLFIPKMIIIFFKSLYIFLREKPSVIISTGVLASIPMIFIGHLFKKKVIYIESFAKIISPTMTGKFVYKRNLANQFYVQWESMKEFYPNAIYKGGIY